jgi:Tfp pilus assembly protein PilF
MYIAILIKTANLTTAQDYTNFSIQHNLNLKNAMVNLAIINLIQNDYNAALTNLLATNLSNIAENSIIKLVIASIYDYQGKHQIAIKYYEEVVQLNQYLKQPLNWIILNNYALIGNKLKTDQILYDFAKSEKLDAKNTILLKVGFYINMNWYNDAYLLLKKNYTKYLHDPKYIYNYASMAAFTQNTKQAIALYKQYLKLDANNAIVYNDLAFVYAEQTKDYKSASIYANKAFELNPEDPNILDTYGWVYYKRGDFLNALKYVKASVDMQYNVESARHLKDIYIALNQLDQANAVIIIKQDIQANQRKQLLDKAVGLLNYIQFGIEIK